VPLTGGPEAVAVWVAAGGVAASVLLGQRAPPVGVLTVVGTSRREWGALLGAAVVLLLFLPGGVVAPLVVALLAGCAGRHLWRQRAATARAERTARCLLEACDLVAAELAAGRTGEAALTEAAQAWPAFGPVADVCRLGGDVPASMRALSAEPGADGLRLLAAAWVISQRTGAGLASSSRRVADSVRRDQATRRLVRGELASARATARLVAVLPVVALLMGSGAGADPWTFLLRTPPGIACLSAGLAVGFAGLWWIELIAREVDR
jgi:tight adherence protein B